MVNIFDKLVLKNIPSLTETFHLMFSTEFGIICHSTDLVFGSYLMQAIIRINKDT